jgi:hypothetical protein
VNHAALAAGSDNFVRKPFELDQIEALINGYLKFRRTSTTRNSEPLDDHLGLHEQLQVIRSTGL